MHPWCDTSPASNTGFEEYWKHCTSCKVNISIFHRNKDRTSVVIPRACCMYRVYITTTTWRNCGGVWQTRGEVPGWYRHLVAQTPCSELTTVNTNIRPAHVSRSWRKGVVLGCLLLFKSVLGSRKTTRDRCMKIASKDPEEKWSALQRKINSTQSDLWPNNWRVQFYSLSRPRSIEC